uniref:TLDc domain-containing protein n=1 Tax=Strongyloides venezuelensis TaxID=75913 RepID=A0A0K0G4W7_STRVS
MAFTLGSGNEGNFFYREPKWSNLHPSGGSLVSGRGHFKPGFISTVSDYKYYINDPLLLGKRNDVEYDQYIF